SQHWQSDEDHAVARVCKTAMDQLKKLKSKNNIFFWLDCFDPHEPWDPPSVYNPKINCPYDPNYEGKDIISPVSTYVDGYLNEEETHHIRMLYAEKITMVDKWIGKFLDKLKELEIFNDSLIIFLSDHGEPLGNGKNGHGIITKCRPWPYEELVHIPLIIYHPEANPNRCSSFVETVDIAPTILNFLKIKRMSGTLQGNNLIPHILGETDRVKDFAIAGYYNFSWSIQTEDWSYVHWLEKKEPEIQKLVAMYGIKMWGNKLEGTNSTDFNQEIPKSNELYNRRSDQFQLNNLLDQEPDISKELHQQLINYLFELRRS
ncbi:MAG: sulfatase family protein, partial [Promethearchaeota archaeon]